VKSFPFEDSGTAKRHAPATLRNREAILAVLRDVLPPGRVLEIASGTGEHAVHFATYLEATVWQPTDPSDEALASIAAYVAESRLANVCEPGTLDVHDRDWLPWAREVAAIVCINMVHIAPWSAAESLFSGADRHLPPEGPLVLYGPYRFHGSFTAPSNEAFDRRLRSENPAWGVRDVDDLDGLAASRGFHRVRTEALPANNHVLVYRRAQNPSALPT
jgi:cyclopropane fatty-acyl-phospholipid synthase-like methyltransferase